MKKWSVVLPLAGTICVEVEAETADEAIQVALDVNLDPEDAEWEVFERLTEGNVFYPATNEATAEEA